MNRQQTTETWPRRFGRQLFNACRIALNTILSLRMDQIWEMYKKTAIVFVAKTMLKSFLYS